MNTLRIVPDVNISNPEKYVKLHTKLFRLKLDIFLNKILKTEQCSLNIKIENLMKCLFQAIIINDF